ncbi:MAG: glycoside hydrolase family 130 protein [Acidimicrobiia bacterium]
MQHDAIDPGRLDSPSPPPPSRGGGVPFELRRIGVVLEPEEGNPSEAEGVLNPAAARGPDGHLYLFPRLVARGNYSRIGIARVRFGEDRDPVGVDRLGMALEPAADYELRADGGGCEDPRISFVESLRLYVITYTAFSSEGPRIALAVSDDLFSWERLGLATFQPEDGLDFNGVDNKDALVFPVAVPDQDGLPAMAMIHRPLRPGTAPQEMAAQSAPRPIDLNRESIWISYCPLDLVGDDLGHLCHFRSNHRLILPAAPWERLKVGGEVPPILTSHGWLVIYHGVAGSPDGADDGMGLRYSAGAVVLDRHDPRVIRYRSPTPILAPELAQECQGVRCRMWCSQPVPTGVQTRASPTGSTCTTGWPTAGSAWHPSICPTHCPTRRVPIRLKGGRDINPTPRPVLSCHGCLSRSPPCVSPDVRGHVGRLFRRVSDCSLGVLRGPGRRNWRRLGLPPMNHAMSHGRGRGPCAWRSWRGPGGS